MNYVDTFIAVAQDCAATRGVVPEPRNGRRTVAILQYEMIAEAPYTLTQEDVLFETWLRGSDTGALDDAERARLRAEFFVKPRACLRASPLPKQYGWGLHFDDEGRVALYSVDSAEYRRLAGGGSASGKTGPKVVRAMRSRKGPSDVSVGGFS
jgi:Family of unknown function (DUF6157)